MGIITGILKELLKEGNKEKDLDKYDLTEEEKEVVRKGNYESHNFEEEDLEDDDYYFEDDN
ncbi:MAG: hypothetical protein IJI49_03765 [Bacilli bacterium]|nr:hypothetical protein [Bacilli bacterium]